MLDTVGKSSFGACKRILKPDGIYISAELGPRGENLYLPLLTRLRGGQRVRFPFPLDIKGSLALVKTLVEQGKFRPVIDEGMRRWYESCSCCLSDTFPDIKAALDAERAATDAAPVDPGICEIAEAQEVSAP